MSLCARACAHEPVRMHPNNWQCRQHRKKQAKTLRQGGVSGSFFLRVLEERGFQKSMDSRRAWILEEHGFQENMDSRGTWILEEHEPVRMSLCASTPTTGSAGNIVKTCKNAAPRGVSGSSFLGCWKNMDSRRTWLPEGHGS